MAKSTANLSKSTLALPVEGEARGRRVGCRYLYHGRVKIGQHRTAALHQHPFWHIDIQVSGVAWLLTQTQRKQIRAGDVYFIPSGVTHGFLYQRASSDFLTIKVAVSGRDGVCDTPLFAAPSAVVQGLKRALLEITPRQGTPAPAQLETIELLSAALISHCYPEPGPDAARSAAAHLPLTQGIKEIVARSQGKISSVKALARHMGYSISHITAQFSAAEGRPLKSYLDQERCRVATWLMTYSDQSIGEVAELLGFPDIYSFSRFFKRLTGKSPRAFRNSATERVSAN